MELSKGKVQKELGLRDLPGLLGRMWRAFLCSTQDHPDLPTGTLSRLGGEPEISYTLLSNKVSATHESLTGVTPSRATPVKPSVIPL